MFCGILKKIQIQECLLRSNLSKRSKQHHKFKSKETQFAAVKLPKTRLASQILTLLLVSFMVFRKMRFCTESAKTYHPKHTPRSTSARTIGHIVLAEVDLNKHSYVKKKVRGLSWSLGAARKRRRAGWWFVSLLGASTMLHNHVSERRDLVACGVRRRLLYFCRACLLGWHPPSRPVVVSFTGPPLRGCARSPPTTLHNINAERSTVCVRRCRPVLCPSALLLCAPRSAIATNQKSKFVDFHGPWAPRESGGVRVGGSCRYCWVLPQCFIITFRSDVTLKFCHAALNLCMRSATKRHLF